MAITFSTRRATREIIAAHLVCCDNAFTPPLSSRVDIDSYALKIIEKAERFEAWVENSLIGLVAAYCNSSERNTAFITSVSVLPDWQGQKIAEQLMANCLDAAGRLGCTRIELEVDEENGRAIALYEKYGFTIVSQNDNVRKMTTKLTRKESNDEAT